MDHPTSKPARTAAAELASAEFAAVVDALRSLPDVTPPGEGHGFGSSGLRVRGRIFAMVSSRGQFVVKLPAPRVDELVASDDGQCYDPGHGRLMREWLALDASSTQDREALAREAMAFVAKGR
jgi:hypothetical protein